MHTRLVATTFLGMVFACSSGNGGTGAADGGDNTPCVGLNGTARLVTDSNRESFNLATTNCQCPASSGGIDGGAPGDTCPMGSTLNNCPVFCCGCSDASHMFAASACIDGKCADESSTCSAVLNDSPSEPASFQVCR